MRILLSNDDGYGAQGLEVLYTHLRQNHEVWIIAPDSERSGTSHGLTLQNVLRMHYVEDRRYKCTGYPADCVNLGLQTAMKDCEPDLVISGINRGSNIGQDIYYSGTCAAAREASFFGIPSMALSLNVRRGQKAHYECLFPILDKIISENIYKLIPRLSSLNINAPNTEKKITSWKYCDVGFAKYSGRIQESLDPKGHEYYWLGSGERAIADSDQNSDLYWSSQGELTVSPCKWIGSGMEDFEVLKEKLGLRI